MSRVPQLPPVSPKLAALLEAAKTTAMTPAQRWDQRVSWAYGNAAIDNPQVTKEMVVKIATELYGPRPKETKA